ncbi:hypothetical protein D9M72_578030 [compost metagenome]
MGSEIDDDCSRCACQKIKGLDDPENRGAQHQVAHRAAANASNVGEKDEADNVELAA